MPLWSMGRPLRGYEHIEETIESVQVVRCWFPTVVTRPLLLMSHGTCCG